MKPLAEPVAASSIAKELNSLSPLKVFRKLEIYQLHGDECPQTMLEIGRIRELVFRQAGAGRGEERDIDTLDRGELGYKQLVVWDPNAEQIVALYRFQLGVHALEGGDKWLRTTTMFDYSERFREEWLGNGIELGRSVVNPEARKKTLGFFAVWQGLGALLQAYPDMSCFFGNITLYKGLGEKALDSIVSHCETWYAPPEPLLLAKPELRFQAGKPHSDISKSIPSTPQDRICTLKAQLDNLNTRVPPILQSYMGLGAGIFMGQTAADDDFGDAYEMGIVVPIQAIDQEVLAKFTA